MINQTPSDLGKFPVPPSGHPIPRGWFGRLVRFINSLILHGDGQYLTVKHTLDGQTITPTPALLQALGNGGAPPAGGSGANQDLSVSVSGNTATVGLSGSTNTVQFVGTGDVNISGNPSGQIVLSGSAFPNWRSLNSSMITPVWDSAGEMTPIILQYSGYLSIHIQPTTTSIGTDGTQGRNLYCYLRIDNKQLFSFQRDYYMEKLQGGETETYLDITSQDSQLIPVCAGSTISGEYYDSLAATPALELMLYH